MNRTTALLAAALGLTLLVVVAALLVPGALADRERAVPSADLRIVESNIEAGAVTGETVTLEVETQIEHSGGPARNVTVVHRAIDTDSGLLVETARAELGTLDGNREYTPSTSVAVPRDGDYRIRSTVYIDGVRERDGSQTVQGVGTLLPDYARTNVDFRSFPTPTVDIPPIVYHVQRESDGEVSLDVTPFLTNTGDEPEDGLQLVVLARQADSNIVADRTAVSVGTIEPGRTTQPSVTVTVPDEYNYYLDAMLQRDGVVVASESVPASLDPTEELEENVTRRDIGLDTSDFATDDGPARTEADREPTDGEDGPGFGAAGAIVALLVASILYTRRSR